MLARLIASLRARRAQDWVRDIDVAAKRNDWDNAWQTAHKAIAAFPLDPVIRLRAAMLCERRGDHGATIEHARALIRVSAELWAAHAIRVRALHHSGRYAEAISAAGEAEALAEARRAPNPVRSDLSLWHGLAKLRAMRTAEAQTHFVRAYELDRRSDISLQLATYARVMAFRWPAEREALEPCVEASSRASRLAPDIVYFFVEQSDAPHPSARGVDYFELLRLSAASARKAMPGARVRLMTDFSTSVPEGIVDDVLRYPVPSDRLMVARLLANAQFLDSGDFRHDTVFVDPAIYFLRDCRDAFRGEFDLGYTWRSDTVESRQDIMPLYAGVLFAPEGRGKPAAAFLRECLACLEALQGFPAVVDAYPQGIERWWGDQLAPAAVLGWQQFYDIILPGRSDRVRVNGTVLRFFDAEAYNYAVREQSRDELAGRCIVNFKGERKRAMPQFHRWFSQRSD